MKITEEALAMLGELTGTPTDVFGEDTYILFTVISIDPLEFNAKFMNEELILEEVRNDSTMHILSM
jgi:hypothetical protein